MNILKLVKESLQQRNERKLKNKEFEEKMKSDGWKRCWFGTYKHKDGGVCIKF